MLRTGHHLGGRRRRRPPHHLAASALIAVAALACEHGALDAGVVDPPEDVQTLARRLLIVEAATNQLTAATVTVTHAEAIVLVAAGQLGASAAALYMMASGLPPKPVDPKAFAEWIERAPKQLGIPGQVVVSP